MAGIAIRHLALMDAPMDAPHGRSSISQKMPMLTTPVRTTNVDALGIGDAITPIASLKQQKAIITAAIMALAYIPIGFGILN